MPRLLRLMLVNLIRHPFPGEEVNGALPALVDCRWFPLVGLPQSRLVDLVARRSSHFQQVYGAMRYGQPSIPSVLSDIQSSMPDELVVMPLFPQYASATTGSVAEEVMRVISRWPVIPTVRFVQHFYQHETFINLFASRIDSYQPHTFDHVVFSYHGLRGSTCTTSIRRTIPSNAAVPRRCPRMGVIVTGQPVTKPRAS